ncbi:hypothetical protein [Bosea sp. 117]|uniref:hypothetical protein n=1 Tax=Bosea sp. 117 TaxID=1125973 RepID=UPI0004940DA0|nr:hypothetical protein [Bosea sp. 117]
MRGAQWSEIDLEAAVWTVPAGRMTAGREHRVPFGKRAIELLGEVAGFRQKSEAADLVFPV